VSDIHWSLPDSDVGFTRTFTIQEAQSQGDNMPCESRGHRAGSANRLD
jgi:hypothetical protein